MRASKVIELKDIVDDAIKSLDFVEVGDGEDRRRGDDSGEGEGAM